MAPKSHTSKKKISTASTSSASGSKLSRKTKQFTSFNIEQNNQMTHNLRDLHDSGRYAKVYRGELNSKDIAVKVYTKESEPLAKNEIEAFSDIGSYPNIISLIGICYDQKYYLVMKFVRKNLQQLLEGFELKWPQTLKILRQLAHAIKEIINENYVIADIKPDNVLIDEDYNVYLCDFGSAKKEGRELPTINFLYTAKEVIELGKGTSKTDIYSYGVILLQMIMRCNDFGAINFQKSVRAQVEKLLKPVTGKKKKKASNSSNEPNPHISIQARFHITTHDYVVNKVLIQSGCDEEDAVKITKLGISCTSEEMDLRPSIQDIISTLEQLKIKKVKS